MTEELRKFGMADIFLAIVVGILLTAVCILAMSGCTIRDGYLVAEAPAIAVSGEYYSPGYGGVSVGAVVPPVYPGYGRYGYDPYYSGYRRFYPPRVVYRRPYYPPSVVYRTRVVHHHHHPAYRQHVAVPERRYQVPVRRPVYRDNRRGYRR